MVGVRFVLCGHHLLELALDLERRLAGCEPGAVADAEYMRIDRDRGFPERNVEHHIGGLAADARQGLEVRPTRQRAVSTASLS